MLSRQIFVLALLLCPNFLNARVRGQRAKINGRGRRMKAESGKRKSGKTSLGGWTAATEPMHKVMCGDRYCRPGEGNIKGYEHWKQPYEPPSEEGLTRNLPHGVLAKAGVPFHYASLLATASKVQQDGMVVFCAADFDYRELAENWFTSARRAGMSNMFVYSLDNDAFGYLSSKGVTTVNGTANLNAWSQTRLVRHIQRALAERHMALAAIAASGMDVLLMDTTHVITRDLMPYFRAKTETDLLAQRGGCISKKHLSLGCSVVWNFLFLRGSTSAERRDLMVRYVEAALDLGMVDFYLRWWTGHHCIEGAGYPKLFFQSSPQLEAPLTPEGNAANPNQTAVVILRKKKWCTEAGWCLHIGMLPMNLFPVQGKYPQSKSTALIGRSIRPKVRHRLRLDRYDDEDFDSLRINMMNDGLWLLN